MNGAAFSNEPVELVRADAVEPGDEIDVGSRIGFQVVSRIEVYGDEIVIVYFLRGEMALENKARERGISHRPYLVERGLVARPGDEIVRVRRGSMFLADELREQMEREQVARWQPREERQRKEAERREQERARTDSAA